jgi:NodT family efflux transporter outer membrane factor (OMF) lipoprotein
MKFAPYSIIIVALCCLGGCAVGPNYRTPATTLPSEYSLRSVTTQPAATQPESASAAPQVNPAIWWQFLGDAQLNSLVQRAVSSNPDLEIALTRLQEVRTQEVVISGGVLPVADFSAGAGRGTGTNSTKNRVQGPLNAGTNSTGLKEITEVVGFDAGWDLDLFGRYRREIEAAQYDTQAAREMRNDILVRLIAQVAAAYGDLRAGQMRLDIVRQAVQTAQQTADLVQARFNRGLTDELDVALARRQLASVQARVAPLESAVEESKGRIAVLLGAYPQDLSNEFAESRPLPSLPPTVQAGLPVDLLRRRPDIRQAERALGAATARIGVATANLFPRVGITAGAGFQGQGLGREPDKTSFLWSAGPLAYWPILDFGTLDAQVDIADLRTHELLVNYKRTILIAVEQVNDAIENFASQQDRLRRLGEALDASQQAVTLASQRYDRGLTDFLNVLDSQRQLYDLQDQFASAQESTILQFIALYQAMGGGWENFQAIPPLHKPQPAILATFNRVTSSNEPMK